MPPLPPVANVLKLQVLGTNEGQNWANVFHAYFDGAGPSYPDAISIAEQVLAAYGDRVMPQVQENWHTQECIVTDLTSDTGAQGTFAADVGGGLAGNPLTAQVATCISWPIARRYRGGHPRTYVPGPRATDALDSSHWKPAYLGAIEAAMALFQTDVNAIAEGAVTAMTLGCVSYVLDLAPRDPPVFFPYIGDPIAHSRIDTQRRRLGKETS